MADRSRDESRQVLWGQLGSACALVRQVVWRAVIPSTQDEARQLARQAGQAGVLVMADRQSAGRGRRGRTWHSPPGGLWLSLVVAPRRPRAEWAFLTPLAALAVREALAAVVDIDAGIKWPNDLLVGGRKIAGVLAELAGDPWVVLGVGVNLGQRERDFPTDLRPTATSVRRETGRSLPGAALLPVFLRRLSARVEEWERRGPSALQAPLRQASLLLGRDVTIAAPGAADRVCRQRVDVAAVGGSDSAAPAPCRGRVVDIGAHGELIVETAAGERRAIASGEIVAVAPPLTATGATRPRDEG